MNKIQPQAQHNKAATRSSSSALDFLGAGQGSEAHQSVSDTDFSKLLSVLDDSSVNLRGMFEGEASSIDPEMVFELIEKLPKEGQVKFLEELKSDLPEFMQKFQNENSIEGSAGMEFSPGAIVEKIQEVIDIVKDGTQKLSEALGSVFDGGIFKSLMLSDSNPKEDLKNITDQLKKIAAKSSSGFDTPEKKVSTKDSALGPIDTDEMLGLRKFAKNNQAHKLSGQQVKNFSKFENQNNILNLNKNLMNAQAVESTVGQTAEANKIKESVNFEKGVATNAKAAMSADAGEVITLNQNSGKSMDAESFLGQDRSSVMMPISSNSEEGGSLKTSEPFQILESSNANNTSSLASSNRNKLIQTVSNYLEQANFNSRGELDVAIKHAELGEFNIQINRNAGSQNLDLQIKAASAEGLHFFRENESELIRTLNDKGIQLSSLKVSSKGEATINFGLDKQDSFNGRDGSADSQNQDHKESKERLLGQSRNQGQSGQEKRKHLWQKAQESFLKQQSA